jgi:hypothetical protein
MLPALTWAQFFVRTAEVSLVPPEPLALGGYTERQGAVFEPGGDRLFARVVVFEQGTTQVALVAAELLTIPESLAREVRRRLPDGVRLMLVATHTHCAPDSQMLNERMTFPIPGIATFRRRWLDWYAQRIAGAVHVALAAPATWNPTPFLARVALDHNRARRPGAVPDPDVAVLAGSRRPWLAVYAAHPTLFDQDERRLRGDWPGEAMRALLGAVVATGPIGDVSPRAEGPTPEARARTLGQDVARVASTLARRSGRIADGRWTDASGPLRWGAADIELGEPLPHPEFATANKIPQTLAQALVERFAPTAAQVSVLAFGRVALIGIPGEPTAGLGHRLREAARAAGFADAVVVSHANGWVGYILEANDYARGGYEARLAFHGPGLADRVVAAARRALADSRTRR